MLLHERGASSLAIENRTHERMPKQVLCSLAVDTLNASIEAESQVRMGEAACYEPLPVVTWEG